MLAGKSPFDVGGHDMTDQSTEDYLFQGVHLSIKSIYQCIHSFIHPSICLSIHQYVYQSIHFFIYSSISPVILEKTIRIPRSLSVKAAQVSVISTHNSLP